MPRKTDKSPSEAAPADVAAETAVPSPGAVERVGQTLERALDPLTTAFKRVGLRRGEKREAPAAAPAAEAAPAEAAPAIRKFRRFIGSLQTASSLPETLVA